MKTLSTSTRRLAAALGLVAGAVGAVGASAFARPLLAQTATPEGTVITNTATATFTDANGNSYSSVSASASVTVGFAPGVSPVTAASVTPASPSTSDTLPVTLKNVGNGTDSVTVGVTAPSGVTVTGYVYNGTTYSTLAALNTALSSVGIPANGSISVALIYSVASGQGGQTLPIVVTETSRRSTSTTASSTTNVQPPVVRGLSVGPDGATTTNLPSNGTVYSYTFTVANSGNSSETYNLATTLGAGGALTVASVNGTAGTSGTVTVAAGATANVVVQYTVGNVAAGTAQNLKLTATAQSNSATSDPGDVTVTVIRPAVTLAKVAYKDDQTTAFASTDRVLPGQYIQYRITVTNGGTVAASAVSVSDPLPSAVTYVSSSADASGWTLSQSSGTVTGALSGTLAPNASRFFWIRVQVK